MPKKTKKLSILVPVYNVESFLPLCLESIINQTFKDFECFLINDGSTDGSLKILKQYAKSDKRLKIINKKNSGYGASLNEALKKATGEYISIVEPDDFLNTKFYELLFEHDADIIKSSFMKFYGKTWKTVPERVFHEVRKDFPRNGKAFKPEKTQKIFVVDPTIWSAVYKRELLEQNHIKFLETPGASYQDVGFQFKAFASVKEIFCLDRPLYYYRVDNAASSVKSSKKLEAVRTEFDSVDEFIKQKPEFKTIAAACRFRSYNWNLNRLKFSDALKFAKLAKRDFRKKSFDPNYFKTEHHARAGELKFSTKHPVAFVFLRPLFHSKNFLKHSLYLIFVHK